MSIKITLVLMFTTLARILASIHSIIICVQILKGWSDDWLTMCFKISVYHQINEFVRIWLHCALTETYSALKRTVSSFGLKLSNNVYNFVAKRLCFDSLKNPFIYSSEKQIFFATRAKENSKSLSLSLPPSLSLSLVCDAVLGYGLSSGSVF